MASFGNSVGQAAYPLGPPPGHFSYGTHRNSQPELILRI
jgi:hypothetical protein